MAHLRDPKLVVANWKMNGSLDLVHQVLEEFDDTDHLVVCPPAPYIPLFIESDLFVGGQDCSAQEEGAHTGDVSAQQLYDVGCTHVIVGHSERRLSHRETNEWIHAKAKMAIRAGLMPIICIGERDEEQTDNHARQTLLAQLSQCTHGLKPQQYIVAYEPVWAIGSGKTPSNVEIETAINTIKSEKPTQVLYGGSVSNLNASQIALIPDLDGVLVGGASLEINKLNAIVKALS